MKFVIFIFLTFFVIADSWPHSGRTDASGCHNNRKTGGYHCHGAPRSSSTKNYSTPAMRRTTPRPVEPSKRDIKDSEDQQYDKDLVRKTQVFLNYLGYDAGPEGGIFGTKTQSAIKKYQSDNQFKITGYPSQFLATIMETNIKKSNSQ